MSPGSGTDALYRANAKVLSAELQAPVIVGNKPGADGGIFFRELARAGADGQTLLAVSDSMLNLLPAVPTVAESEYSGFSMQVLIGLGVHSGTPEPLVRALEAVAVKAARDPVNAGIRRAAGRAEPCAGCGCVRRSHRAEDAAYRDSVARSGVMQRFRDE